MAKGSAVERLYHAVKAEITNRSHLPGQRIDIAGLCERHAVSPTPMRNVLNRLVGERLVETHSHDGFYIPRITEESLRSLFAWNEHLVVLAIDTVSDLRPHVSAPVPIDDVVVGTETLFTELAALSPNPEVGFAIASLNDRVRPVRRLPDAGALNSAADLASMRSEWDGGDLARLRQRVMDYHTARLSALPQIIALAYTAPLKSGV